MTQSGSFRKVAKGGAVFTVGLFSAKLLQFVTGVVVIRIVEPSEYGLISLGMTTVFMLSFLCMLGLRVATPRFLAKYRAQGDQGLMDQVAGTALTCSLAISLLFAVLLHGEARLAALAFHKPEMEKVFELLAMMLPAVVVIYTVTAIFQGVENARAKLMFEDLGWNLLRLAMLMYVALAGLGYHEVLWTYVVSVWLALALYLGYAVRALRGVLRPRLSFAVAKDLLWFSLPLLATGIMSNLTTWSGTLTLGYFQPSSEVGLFNAPMRLAFMVPAPVHGIVTFYLPVATRFAVRSAMEEIHELYESSTKWAFFFTLPFLLYFVIDAEFVVTFLFGAAYGESADVLRVLLAGVAMQSFLGPNAATLVAFGYLRTQFVATILAGSVAVALCLLLVPQYGAMGAAIGAAGAHWVSGVIISVSLYRRYRIHPLVSSQVKPALFAVACSTGVGMILQGAHFGSPLAHLLLFFGIAAISIAAPLITRTLSRADLELIGSVERRIRGRSTITDRMGRWVTKGFARGGSDI